jgi:enamine deaminase RidA (YjgF/YER057c/UK114 family)
MIRRSSRAEVTYSVVEVHGVRHLFGQVVPRSAGDIGQQVRDALRNLELVDQGEGFWGSIVQQVVFFSDARHVEICQQIMRDFYGDQLPAVSYVPQTPCGGELLEIEFLGVAQEYGRAEIRRLSERTVAVQHGGVTWVHCANVVPDTPRETVYDRTLDALGRLERELNGCGFRFDQVVRMWLYLGDIVGLEDRLTRYQKLNLARTDFFRSRRLAGERLPGESGRAGYPASTGIGADGRDVMVCCLALATDRPDVLRVPLENPRQIAAHDYDQRYGPHAPKFSRAMAIVDRGLAAVLVSGTASILDSESRHVDDVGKQTRETLDNIAALISADNFRRHGLDRLGATLDDLASVRVYVKRREDYAAVRNACRARLPDVPAVYAVADLCRPELLVEIEGIAFCGRA